VEEGVVAVVVHGEGRWRKMEGMEREKLKGG